MTTDKLLYSRDEAAQMLNVCARTIDRLVKNGDLHARTIGRRILFSRHNLETFVNRPRLSR